MAMRPYGFGTGGGPAGESREGGALFGGATGVPPNPYPLRFPPGKWADVRSWDGRVAMRPYDRRAGVCGRG